MKYICQNTNTVSSANTLLLVSKAKLTLRLCKTTTLYPKGKYMLGIWIEFTQPFCLNSKLHSKVNRLTLSLSPSQAVHNPYYEERSKWNICSLSFSLGVVGERWREIFTFFHSTRSVSEPSWWSIQWASCFATTKVCTQDHDCYFHLLTPDVAHRPANQICIVTSCAK